MLIGHQLEYVSKVFKAKYRPLDAGNNEIDKNIELAGKFGRVVMQILVSLIVLILSFWILLNRNEDDQLQKFASGSIGTILGYWLR